MGNLLYSMENLIFWKGRQTAEDETQLRLQKECKDNICRLDEAIVRLLMSLDAMHATAEMLLAYLNMGDCEPDDRSVVANQNMWECKAVAARLLIKMERIFGNEKREVVSSLSTFLNFFVFNANGIFKSDSAGFTSLRLDSYTSDPKDLQCTENNYIKTIQNEKRTLIQRNEDNAILRNENQDLKSRLEEEENNSRKRAEHCQNELAKLRGKVSNVHKQNKELKLENESQKKQLEKQDSVIKGMEENKNGLQVEVNILLSKCTDIEKQNGSLTSELNHLKREKIALNDLHQEMLKMKDRKITELNEEKCSLVAVIKGKEESISELKHKIQKTVESTDKDRESQQRSYEREIKEKDKAIVEIKRDVSNYEQQLRNKEHMIRKHESEKTVLMEENTTLHTKQKELSACLRDTEKDLEILRDTVSRQNEEIQTLRIEMEEKASDLQTLKMEMDRKDLDILLLKKECNEKKSQITTLTNQYEENNNELIRIMSKKSLHVQLYCQQNLGWTASIEKELLDSLKSEMKSVDDKIELSFFKTSRSSDILPDIPLLLICVTISRLGTDVFNATQGITLAPNTALMIFHHKDEHALPNQASERVLTAKELRGVGGIFDMAFKSDRGIYTCVMNSNTIASVVTFLRRKTT